MQKKKTAGRRPPREPSSLSTVERLLFSRQQTAFALGDISIATVQRLENAGLLDKVRLVEPNGAVFHRVEQVRELARRRGAGAA